MLSIGRLVAGAERYYLSSVARGREEYYTGSGEAPGVWLGGGAARLGLDGPVDAATLSMLLAGMSPDGEALLARRVDPLKRVAGLDLTFSAPKSVSLLYGLGDARVAAAVRDLHAEAVADALGYLERRALRVRRGAGGAELLGAEGFVAAAFVHRTSRAGDPQLHTHVLVANLAYGSDGKWSATWPRLLYHHARTAGFLYQASLRARLTDALGVRFGPVKSGAAELEGIPKAVLRGFSARRQAIEAHLANLGADSPAAAEIAALVTRTPKLPAAACGSDEELRARWRSRAHELGLDPASIARLLGAHEREALTEARRHALVARLVGDHGLTSSDSVFERRDVVRGVAELMADGASAEEIEAVADLVLGAHGVVALTSVDRGAERRHTTEELLAVESRAIGGALERRSERVGVVEPRLLAHALAGAPRLAPEQQAMVARLITSGAGVDVVVGKAGSGKTAALTAARHAWELAGHRVLGTSLSARAAKGLHDGAGIESTTLAGLLSSLDTGAEVLGAGDVVVVDEAGMVGTRQLARLLDAASRARAKVVLVGDPRQLPEIEAGGVFGALARRLGALELCENRRQHEPWEREALDELRSGDPLRGLGAFAAAGRVVTAPGMAETMHALVARWQESQDRGEDALMLAATRREVDALNVAARRVLKQQGLLGEDVATFGDLALAVGDAVVATRNDRRLGVRNGTRGVVEHLDRAGVVVSTPEGRLRLPAPYASAHLAHGYALTVHKAQGATVDSAFVLVTDALTREAGYVAMSRARKGSELFVPSVGVDEDLDCVDGPTQPDDPLVRVGQRLSVSRAKRLALEEHQPQLFDVRGHEEGRSGDVPPTTARSARRPESAAAGDFGPVPAYQAEAIGYPPAFADERREYERVARVLAEYRDRYQVVGREPLGPVPVEALRRTRYEEACRELRRYERRLGRARELGDPDLGLGR